MANKKGVIEKVVESAVDATEELGAAATAFRESWEHVKKAKHKANPATRAAAKAGRAVTRVAKKGVRKVTGRK